jgi:hypothetical protein
MTKLNTAGLAPKYMNLAALFTQLLSWQQMNNEETLDDAWRARMTIWIRSITKASVRGIYCI